MRRVEHILPQRDGGDEDTCGTSLEVIRVKSKRGSGNSRNKKKKKERVSDGDLVEKRERTGTINSQISEPDPMDLNTGRISAADISDVKFDQVNRMSLTSCDAGRTSPKDLPSVGNIDSLEVQGDAVDTHTSIPQFDSGVDIHSMLISENFSADKERKSSLDGSFAKSYDNSKSAFAQIENKIAELCFVPEENHLTSKNPSSSYGLSDTRDIASQEFILSSEKRNLPQKHNPLIPYHDLSHKSSMHNDNNLGQSQSAFKAPVIFNNTEFDSISSSKDVSEGALTSKHTSQNLSPNTATTSADYHKRQDPMTSETSKNPPERHLFNATTNSSMDNLDTEDDFDFYAWDSSEADQGETTEINRGMKMTAATAQITSAHAASQLEVSCKDRT